MAARCLLAGLTGAWLIGAAVPAAGAQGEGAWNGGRRSILSDTGAMPIERLGPDVIRFSAAPALGGRSYIVELYPTDAEWAGGQIRFYSGHPRPTGRLTLRIRRAEHDALSASVDAGLAKGEPAIDQAKGDIVICTDGPGWVTERRRRARSRWLSGFCGDHPNVKIHRRPWQIVSEQMALYGGR